MNMNFKSMTAILLLVISCMTVLLIGEHFRNNELKAQIDDTKKEYEELEIKYIENKQNVQNLVDIVVDLNTQNKSLVSTNDKYYKDLIKFEKRQELYDKYEYAIEYGGARTDITYAQLETAEKLMTEKGMDPNLLLGIVMTESNGKETVKNNTSTALGYGQFLDSTGKFTYEQLMDNGSGTYNHYECASDGDIAIEMMAHYLEYLKETTGGNVYSIIRGYRGCYDSGYIAKVDSFIRKNDGTTLANMNFK